MHGAKVITKISFNMEQTNNNFRVFTDISDFANEYTKGTFGLYAGTITEPKMNKYPKGTPRSEYKNTPANPYMGVLKKHTFWKNAACGKSYYAIVKAECEREGIEFTDEEFKAAFPREKTYCDSEDNIIFTHEDGIRQYIRLYAGQRPTKSVSFYFLNGKLVPKGSETMQDIKRYMSEDSGSAKQEALGIKNIVRPHNYSLANLVFLSQGSRIYINPDYAGTTVDMETVKGYFSKE